MKKMFSELFISLLITAILLSCGVVIALAGDTAESESTVETLIDSKTVWKYLDDDTDPAENLGSLQAWTAPDFDDSGWKSAVGSFGSKGGVIGSVTGCGTPTTLINLYKPSDSSTVISTYYFRTDFEISKAASVSAIDFTLHADDAVIVYLNGTVILDSRTSVPEAAATTNKYYASITAAAQSFSLDYDALFGVLRDGENTLAVELHNNQAGSSDIFFGIDSMNVTSTSEEIKVEGNLTEVLDGTAIWKYLDDDTDPAEGLDSLQGWTAPDFDDSGWKSAVGSFGSKGGVIGSVTGCGTPTTLINLYKPTDPATVISTYYFRTAFEVEKASAVLSLELSLHADDAVIVYLNGTVILDSRSSVPDAAATTNKYYASITAAAQSFSVDYDTLDGVLRDGENTLAVELHNNQAGSSDIFFGLDSFSAMIAAVKVIPTFEQIVIGVGADETERGLAWYSRSSAEAYVEYAPVGADKEAFPGEYQTAAAVTAAAQNKPGYYNSKAVMTGLIENTEYVYRIVSDGESSPLKYFRTTATDQFEFVFVGDPQFGSAAWSAEWVDTLDKIDANFGAELIVSAGDQINTPSSENEYSYFIVDGLSSVAFAPTVGPAHDDPSIAFSEHFYTPNLSDKYGVTVSSANYWYRYGNTLFMHLNMADGTALESEHKLFIMETMAQNTDAVWKIVVLHKALFATGAHGNPDGNYFESEMSVIRPILAEQLSELGIDIAMGGHDHIYVRSHLMSGTDVSDDEVFDNKAINPTGTLHISASSSTGSKFHTSYSDDVYFAAYQNDEKRKSAIHFVIDGDSIVMNSYFLDTMTVFDSFTIEKKLKPDGSVPGKAVVKWLDADGNLIATNTGYESFTADAPSDAVIPSGDGYRNVRITRWLDEYGNITDLVIGTDSEYTFTAAKEQPGDGGYTASISEAMINFCYYSQFHMNLYLPIIDGMERPAVSGASASYATAFISNREYWVYTWWLSTTTATDDKTVNVSFTIDGVNYADDLKIGGLIYAELILSDSVSEEEKNCVANMLRYVREAKVYAGKTTDERFDSLIGSYDGTVEGLVTLPDYPTQYAATDTELGGLEKYLSKVYLGISGSPNFILVLNDAGVAAGLDHNSFTVYTESGVRIYLFNYANNGTTYQTNNMRVYDAIEKLTFTLTVPAAAGESATVIKGTYSIGTYISELESKGENVKVAKALYAFGEAVAEYRKTIKN